MSDAEDDAAEREDAAAEDAEPSPEALAAELEAIEAERDELAGRVEDLEEERDELESRVKRTVADFENYKKRQEKKRAQAEAAATEQLIERLLDVRDNLERAIEQAEGDGERLREGIKLTLAEFDRVLDAEDVTEIAPEPGESVDPNRHEVMMRVDGEQPEGRIEEVYTPGYAMHDSVLRAAQVAVSEGASTAESGDESTADR